MRLDHLLSKEQVAAGFPGGPCVVSQASVLWRPLTGGTLTSSGICLSWVSSTTWLLRSFGVVVAHSFVGVSWNGLLVGEEL